MDPHSLNLLCSPLSKAPLRLRGEALIANDEESFAVRDGIPILLPFGHRLTAWQNFYDRVAIVYDPTLQLGSWLHLGSENRIRSEFLAKLRLPPVAVIADLGCGTASSRPAFGQDVDYLGLDLSLNMLKRAQQKSARLNLHSTFVQADAENLPIQSRVTDLTLAMGLLQHIARPENSLAEMARVTKRGGVVMLIDEVRSLPAVTGRLGQPDHQAAQIARWLESNLNLVLQEQSALGEYYVLTLLQTV